MLLEKGMDESISRGFLCPHQREKEHWKSGLDEGMDRSWGWDTLHKWVKWNGGETKNRGIKGSQDLNEGLKRKARQDQSYLYPGVQIQNPICTIGKRDEKGNIKEKAHCCQRDWLEKTIPLFPLHWLKGFNCCACLFDTKCCFLALTASFCPDLSSKKKKKKEERVVYFQSEHQVKPVLAISHLTPSAQPSERTATGSVHSGACFLMITLSKPGWLDEEILGLAVGSHSNASKCMVYF